MLGRIVGLFFALCAISSRGHAAGELHFYDNPESGTATYINGAVGAGVFYNSGYFGASTTVANVEAGHIWFGHEVFNRPPSLPSAHVQFDNPEGGDEIDFHATMVGHVLAGTGFVSGTESDPQLSYVGMGMAPLATIASGAIATEFSTSSLGAFETSTASTLAVYEAFFTGTGVQKADVINSSWGGSDPAATGAEAVSLDGMARENPTVVFVASAGNGGSDPVGWPGSGYNNITVGSVGGTKYRTPSSFSSRGPLDFHDPVLNVTYEGVRAGVDIAAPGESLFLAAYLGDTGGLGAWDDPLAAEIINPDLPTDLYFTRMDGTSFSAPTVAGGVALLKDVGNGGAYWNPEELTTANDSRVIKSVLMASARETEGWDNGQEVVGPDGVIVTDQALDYSTGAGLLDLGGAATVYFSGTKDIAGDGGGFIDAEGWDLGALAPGASNEYFFLGEFTEEINLAVSLNWFADRAYDEATDIGSDLSFANLDLQVWYYGDDDPRLIAQSISLYNNAEFLRLTLTDPGLYGLTVTFEGMIYGTTTSEAYGLAWHAVPEPTAAGLVAIFAAGILIRRRARRGSRLRASGSPRASA